jgi:hypothetical protein
MNSQRLASPTPVPVDVYTPLVWVEAEQVFVARGYIYRARGRRGKLRDSEAEIARITGGFVVLSSFSPPQLEAMPPRGWKQIEPVCELNEGERIGDVIVAVRHGTNEYTVVNTVANSMYLAQTPR